MKLKVEQSRSGAEAGHLFTPGGDIILSDPITALSPGVKTPDLSSDQISQASFRGGLLSAVCMCPESH